MLDQHLTTDDMALFTRLRMTAFGEAVIDIANDPTYDQWTFSQKIRHALEQETAARTERRVLKLLKASRTPNPAACVEDIHELHQSLPNLDRATYERLELVRRGGWVTVGEEGNRLPYWVSRHSLLHYRVDGRPRSFEVRVLITWDDHWYVTHLNEFH